MRRGVFVTGTDTGVGKTIAACALIHALRSAGERVAPMKPVAAGAVERSGLRVNEDSVALMDAAGLALDDIDRVTPVLLAEPMAPHIAAAREGRRIKLEPVLAALEAASPGGRFLVVEGVGGFLVPLGDALDTADLARAVGLPVVLVVGLRLGCLNHALLTARAIEGAGLALAGWIANEVDPAMAVPDENVAALRARLRAPLLGRLPWGDPPDPRELAERLDVRPLLGRDA
ncbi:MAG TPA: dethiobiotin synthase [Usitatibacter sp.]|nr:dethiobiotin synthase [Usitatibacter sp.]